MQKLLLKESPKIEEVIGDLIGNKIADKITLVGKRKSKGKEDEIQEDEKRWKKIKKDSKLLIT